MQLAEQHGPVSWDVLQAYLELVLPIPAAKASLSRDPTRALTHSADGEADGGESSANSPLDAVRVSHHPLRLYLCQNMNHKCPTCPCKSG